jgi:glutamate-1-semialdehyde aminotransferase
MRLLPGGVLGGYYAPQELAFIVREARGARLYDHSGREYIDYVSLAHTDADIERTLDAFASALRAAA